MSAAASASATLDALDDAALVQRVGAGDHAAFACVMRRYNRRLYRLARAMLRDEAEAEDALQEAYLAAYHALPTFRGESLLSTWLSRLVMNECLGRLRRAARRQNIIPMVGQHTDFELETMVSDDREMPDQAAARSEMRALLERKLDALPESFRVVFVLRCVEELSVDETAACLGIPAATVRTRHFRARSLLRESLAQAFDVAERDVFEFGGAHCDRVVARVLERLPPKSG